MMGILRPPALSREGIAGRLRKTEKNLNRPQTYQHIANFSAHRDFDPNPPTGVKESTQHWLAMNKKTNSKRKEREILVVAETSKWYSQVTAMFLWILGENKNIINVCEHESLGSL
ncbi:hypothetical protein M513_13189 [Trichuris suis]|uniref:Uncharacterized protein n=1 Tax=Trichuris suis TaxID=68888 RepID=A0A085LLT4_9BILA|nr:hypothetical protein M513_13189 [Trichuris suis]